MGLLSIPEKFSFLLTFKFWGLVQCLALRPRRKLKVEGWEVVVTPA